MDKIQGGVDDCRYHREVTREDLEELRDKCKEILEGCVQVRGKVKNGSRLDQKTNQLVPIYEDGLLVANPEICKKLLPCTDGYFFGSDEYDQWYMRDIQYTFEKISKVLEETDFENQMIYYRSSW